MKNSILCILAISAISFNLFALESPKSKAQFCEMRKDPENFKEIIKSGKNRLSFTNYGGLLNGGVCWWHSMFTRNATYLAIYQPELAKPTREQAKKIIQHIVVADAVTYIPGFSNLAEFSNEYQGDIESALESWQITDGGIGFGWVRGVTGHASGQPDSLKKTMDSLYDLVANKHEIVYQMLGMSGLDAHAWLVVDVKKNDSGYDFTVVDSNYLMLQKHTYYNDENSLRSYGGVMLYNSRNFDSVYKNAGSRLCNLDISNIDLDQKDSN